MTEPTATPKPRQFPCRQCGARLDFAPGAQTLKCPYCNHEERIALAEGAVEERDYLDYLRNMALGKITGRSCEVKCGGCGAVVLLEDKVATERCPFCTTHLQNEPAESQAMIPPESVLPFKVTDREARTAFNGWIKSRWFAPNELKQLANLGQLAGVYLPFWTYDSMTITRYTGERGDDYQDTETYTTTDAEGNQKTETRTVTRTMWTPAAGMVEHFFDDVLVCASKSVPTERVRELQTWELKELTGFKPEYLSGFKTERYGVGLEEGFEEAKGIMDGHIRQLCCRDIGGNHQRLHTVNTKHLGITFKHLLLPVWLAAYRYREKLYRIFVNARTGHVAGERPWSVWKIVGAVLLGLAIIGTIAGIIAVTKKKGKRSSAMLYSPSPTALFTPFPTSFGRFGCDPKSASGAVVCRPELPAIVNTRCRPARAADARSTAPTVAPSAPRQSVLVTTGGRRILYGLSFRDYGLTQPVRSKLAGTGVQALDQPIIANA